MFVCAWVPVRTCTSDPLKLELIEGKLPDVGAGYWIQVFCKSVLLLTAEPFPLQSLRFKYYAPPQISLLKCHCWVMGLEDRALPGLRRWLI